MYPNTEHSTGENSLVLVKQKTVLSGPFRIHMMTDILTLFFDVLLNKHFYVDVGPERYMYIEMQIPFKM